MRVTLGWTVEGGDSSYGRKLAKTKIQEAKERYEKEKEVNLEPSSEMLHYDNGMKGKNREQIYLIRFKILYKDVNYGNQ